MEPASLRRRSDIPSVSHLRIWAGTTLQLKVKTSYIQQYHNLSVQFNHQYSSGILGPQVTRLRAARQNHLFHPKIVAVHAHI